MEPTLTKQISSNLNLDLEFDSKGRVVTLKDKNFIVFLRQYPIEASWEAESVTFNTWSICLILF